MSTEKTSSYKKLIVWQKAMNLVTDIYEVTNKFPPHEKFSLTSQIRRAAISIPSNIAEGSGRNTKKDFTQFVHIALGSVAELETQIEIAQRLKFFELKLYQDLEGKIIEIKKMLVALRTSLMK